MNNAHLVVYSDQAVHLQHLTHFCAVSFIKERLTLYTFTFICMTLIVLILTIIFVLLYLIVIYVVKIKHFLVIIIKNNWKCRRTHA